MMIEAVNFDAVIVLMCFALNLNKQKLVKESKYD